MTLHKPKVNIAKICFSGGDQFDVFENERVLVVGPNNSGKSELLREIQKSIGWINSQIKFENNKVLNNIYINKTGDIETLKNWLHHESRILNNQIHYKNYKLPQEWLRQFTGQFLGNTAPIFCKNLGTQGRLALTDLRNGAGVDGDKESPQQLMYDDSGLTKRISNLFKEAFNRELFFDYRAAPHIPIHVGTPPDLNLLANQASDEYVREVRKNPRLDQQGDGMRSYAGILFEVIAVQHDITLLDEPEAFLHPPQMRRMGEMLAEEASNQIFVATHSSDILRGFLNGANGAVRIIRLERVGDVNHATMTTPERINELWDQPELRYSNALDGIFHEQVIICEDDSDCRLYNSIADHLSRQNSGMNWPDTAYIPSGGKAAIPKIASALREIGVRVKVIADIDLLSEMSLFRRMVESLGGNWTDFSDIWRLLDLEVRNGVPAPNVNQIKNKIRKLLDEAEQESLPKSEIQSCLKQTNPWSIVKKLGSNAIPNGEAQRRFCDIDARLRKLGVYLVRVGEAENFCPEVGRHGPRFVSKLFETVPLDSDKLVSLRSFVREVFEVG